MTITLLAISGSLRAASYNTAALRACVRLAPRGVRVELFDGMAALPLFNPDEDAAPGPAVEHWRARIRAADGLIIASPEYAHGISGVMKNALDWLVSMPDFPGKPVALLNTSPRAGHAAAALEEVLRTMSARIVEPACVSLPLQGSQLDTGGILGCDDLVRALGQSIAELAAAI